MDKVCRGLSFVTTYRDDVLVHSATLQQHQLHLQKILQWLHAAGLVASEVVYLGHIFSDKGMAQ